VRHADVVQRQRDVARTLERAEVGEEQLQKQLVAVGSA